MCGLTGFLWHPGAEGGSDASRTVQAMADAIAHRGPDSHGVWTDATAGIAFGHRRLAIVDLSEAGHQPMAAPSGRYVLCYNGEIYNHLDLRAELEGAGKAPHWRGHSDTETLNAGFDAWGIEATLGRAVGMFAIAVWDRQERKLTLARDRMGEKPLYVGWQGTGRAAVLLFGSELSALKAHPAFRADIDRGSIVQLMRHSYVGERMSIFAGIGRLAPGEMAEVSLDAPEIKRWPYWSGAEVSVAPRSMADLGDADATDKLEELLLDATGRQMMSDVPLGAFLSGGIDSSTIVGLMQHLSATPVHTFSIGFHEERYNEAKFAAEVAQHLGTHHTELYVGDTELRDVIPKLPTIFDEPFADSSQIPTYLVAELARRHVTVALSGDGGDELFCGYDRYRQGAGLMRRIGKVPAPVRSLAAAAIRAVPTGVYDTLIEPIRATPQGKEPNGQRLRRLADYARSRDVEDLHRKLVSRWRFPEEAVLGASEPASILAEHLPAAGALGAAERMMQLDMLAYMPDDILAKVDRATMAVSLESRAPLLDHRVVEFAWGLPQHFKLRDGQSKWLLRQVLYRHVPRELIERPKMGFEVPIGLWMRGALKDWAADLLDPTRLRNEGYFDPKVIATKWDQHLSGRFNWGLQLWNVLMFQAWLEAQKA
ncbi:MAG: asparagine synthase (glutamine-hydrolyzing) [Pseudomonadota bacterium]